MRAVVVESRHCDVGIVLGGKRVESGDGIGRDSVVAIDKDDESAGCDVDAVVASIGKASV